MAWRPIRPSHPVLLDRVPRAWLAGLTGVCLLSLTTRLAAHAGHDAAAEPTVLAPGYQALNYPAPVPGTYALPALGTAGDGEVLDSDGQTQTLHEWFAGHVVVLSFIYTQCDDVNGCPLATFVLSQLARRVAADSALQSKVRLVSLSFDPGHDTPETLNTYAKPFRHEGDDWQFLTTSSNAVLAPILKAYGQAVQPDARGARFSHVLRVFLIDRERRIRNIYSASFLHVDTVVNDIKTVLLEEGQTQTIAATTRAVQVTTPRAPPADPPHSSYADAHYRTQSRALSARQGVASDALARLAQPPLGLPPSTQLNGPLPTAAQIALGRKLFFDRRLSLNETLSCAMCHIPEQGFTSNEVTTPVGIEGRSVRRNAPTLLNVGYLKGLFYDDRERRLEQQVWNPLLAANEMGNPAIGTVIDKLSGLDDYARQFALAFNGQGPTMETLGLALASYERTLLAGNSAFDRARYGNDPSALSAEAGRGLAIFEGKGKCVACHTIGERYALFTDQQLHNTGIGYRQTMTPPPRSRTVLVAPGTTLKIDSSAVKAPAAGADLGRYEITQDPADRWKYRTPGLRNVALTAPYMHDGSLSSLQEVVAFYNGGGFANELLDPLLQPLGLSAQEQDELVAFLQSLTADNIQTLVEDAFTAPIGDRH